MSDLALVVFTAKSIDRILREGGTSSWRLDRGNARQCGFAICTRNAHADWTEGSEAHRAAFVIGKISDVVPSVDYEGRFLIRFSEYAHIAIPDCWKGDRNPVKYSALSVLGIDPSTLKWRKMPEPSGSPEPKSASGYIASSALTMAEAKRGLALTFGVAPDAIEITIRG